MRFLRLTSTLSLAALAAACSSTGTSNSGSVALNIATNPATATAAVGQVSAATAPETYTDGTNTLVINTVDLVLRKIELKLANPAVPCPDDLDDSNGGKRDDDDCEEIRLEPQLFSLPLGGSTTPQRLINVPLPAGSYREVEFKVHKPTGRAVDRAFLAANPEFDGRSVKVTGTWNGTAFTMYTDVEAEYEFELNPPLEVVEGRTAELTINVDLGTWFRANGGGLINPNTANRGQSNYGQVKSNIQRSIKAFDDDDRDGYDD